MAPVRRLPPLGTLRAFEAAARHLSFKEAANELGLTPTAISHQVRLLEEYCGEKLFHRRPRPLVLSHAGARLFPAICDGFDGFAATLSSLPTESEAKPLRVTTTSAFASRWLVPRISVWREVHPDIPLSIIGVDRVVNLGAGEADLAIRYARSAPRDASPEIFRDQFYPVCSPKLLANGPTIRRASDIGGYPLIHFALSFREELHAIEAVLAGQGIALCGDVVVADDLASGALVKALDLALPGYGFYPVFAPNHPRRAIIEVFTHWISTVERRQMVARVDRSNTSGGKE